MHHLEPGRSYMLRGFSLKKIPPPSLTGYRISRTAWNPPTPLQYSAILWVFDDDVCSSCLSKDEYYDWMNYLLHSWTFYILVSVSSSELSFPRPSEVLSYQSCITTHPYNKRKIIQPCYKKMISSHEISLLVVWLHQRMGPESILPSQRLSGFEVLQKAASCW